MPKQSAKKATTKATKRARTKPRKKPAAKKAKPARTQRARRALAAAPAAPARTQADKRATVHSCIRGCAGHDNFGPNTQLKHIPANAQCVQVCIIDGTGQPIIISDTDTENDIVGML